MATGIQERTGTGRRPRPVPPTNESGTSRKMCRFSVVSEQGLKVTPQSLVIDFMVVLNLGAFDEGAKLTR